MDAAFRSSLALGSTDVEGDNADERQHNEDGEGEEKREAGSQEPCPDGADGGELNSVGALCSGRCQSLASTSLTVAADSAPCRGVVNTNRLWKLLELGGYEEKIR